jgi:hypothetical protein
MGEVVNANITTKGDVPVDRVLESAKAECETVFVLGLTAEGELYAASSTGDTGHLMWLYERWKARLFNDEPSWEG